MAAPIGQQGMQFGDAEALLFPTQISRMGGAGIEAYAAAKFHGGSPLELHRRSVMAFPELAALTRSPRMLREVAEAYVRSLVAGKGEIGPDAWQNCVEATKRYQIEVAAQIALYSDHPLWEAARRYLQGPPK
jgi:hypothetical protein